MERHDSSNPAVSLVGLALPRLQNRRTAGSGSPTHRERKRITISQRMMLQEAIHAPSNAAHAVASLQETLERHRRESPEFCATPLFRRLEAQLKPLIGDEEAALKWYRAGWKRLFSTLRKCGPERRS